MKLYRSTLAVALALVMALMASVVQPIAPAFAATTATPSLEQVQRLTTDLQELRDRMPAVEAAIAAQNWNDVRSVIHGPMGELRARMLRLADTLSPADQRRAQGAVKSAYAHLNDLDVAARTKNATAAAQQYQEVINNIDTVLLLSPAS